MNKLRTILICLLFITVSVKSIAFELAGVCQCAEQNSIMLQMENGEMQCHSNDMQDMQKTDMQSDNKVTCHDCSCGHCSFISGHILPAHNFITHQPMRSAAPPTYDSAALPLIFIAIDNPPKIIS